MGAIANTTTVLASAVADDGNFTLAYPSGVTRADLVGSTGGQIVIGDNDVYDEGDSGVEFSYGASNITVTNRSGVSWAAGSDVIVSFGTTGYNGSYNLSIGDEKGQAAPGNDEMVRSIDELTESGAVAAGAQIVELNHNTVAIAATADALEHPGLFIVRDTSASGTAAHTLTLSNGTFDGTNDIATFNAPAEELAVFIDKYGRGTIVENTGAVALSSS